MKVTAHSNDLGMEHRARMLTKRMVSPLCGLLQRISFMTPGHIDPRFMTAGGELAGVHVLRGQPRPNVNAYHIGGGGILRQEPFIRTLGESVERYAQLVSEVVRSKDIVFASHEQMVARGEAVIAPEKLRFFTDDQFAVAELPFERFSPTQPMGWLRMRSLIGNQPMWVPAQLVLVGYVPKSSEGERWLFSGVTTGTAAHTVPEKALRNCLLELIQIDAVMGHWYSDAKASEIILDDRTRPLEDLIDRHFRHAGLRPQFYWIASNDLPGHVVACVIRDRNCVPTASFGLGCDFDLLQAMYKSLLEAVSVVQLAKITLLYLTPDQRRQLAEGGSGPFLDFDNNVALYAMPGQQDIVDGSLGGAAPVRASELPADPRREIGEELRHLIDGFRATGKELLFLDLTTEDLRNLGFHVFRTWSPDTISLSLPSFPTKAQQRYEAYGGVSHSQPHPYP